MADVLVFHNEDEPYEVWTTKNPQAFVLRGTPSAGYMMHRAHCTYITDYRGTGASPTRSAKLCSTDQHVLDRWGRPNSNESVRKCETCM